MDDCVFCKIVENKIGSYKIYEDEHTLAFLDISKDVDGHTLVIPKKHFVNILDCDQIYLQKTIETVQKVSKHYVEKCGYEGVNLINANNACSGQSVFHLHFHILPRKNGDGVNAWPKNECSKHTHQEMQEKLKMQ